MRSYYYESPKSFEELFAIVKNTSSEVKFLAGGTDVVPRLSFELNQIPKQGLKDLMIVSLANMGLSSISENDEEVKIGATATFTDIKENKIIQKEFPAIIETINEMAGVSVRNTASMGGNIMNASPAADSVPILMSLDAMFVLNGPDGVRKIETKNFFTAPGKTVADALEVLTEIILKKEKGNASFKKLGRRKAETLSVVNAAAYIEKENNICKVARISVGSVAPTVLRCKEVEQMLIGKELTEENIKIASAKVINAINPIDDIRSTAWYRNKVAPVMVKRAIEASINVE